MHPELAFTCYREKHSRHFHLDLLTELSLWYISVFNYNETFIRNTGIFLISSLVSLSHSQDYSITKES